MPRIQIKRGSAAQIAAAAAASGLAVGELALQTDRQALHVGTAADASFELSPSRSATLSVVPAQFGHAEVTVADAQAVGTALVLAQLVPNDDFDADDLDDMTVFATAEAGNVTFVLSCTDTNGPIVGDYAVRYQLEAA